MAKGVDSLVEWCVREISFSNEEGLTPQGFVAAVRNFLDGKEGDGPPDNEDEAEQVVVHNEATTPEDDQAAFEIAATAWGHISARPEVSIGFNRMDRSWNCLSLKDAYHLPPGPSPNGTADPRPDGQPPENSKGLPSTQPRIFTLEEVTWLNITGHGIDTTRIPPLHWKLLVVLACCHEHGATQANLCRLGGGDSRSVPLRTHKLAEQGYLVKRTVVLRGCKTSKLWLTRFAPPELPSNDSPDAWGRDLDLSPSNLTKDLRPVAWCTSWTGTTIDYEAFGRTIIAVIKAWEVLRTVDLKNKLGIHGVKWQMKVLARVLRRFAGAGIVGYVAASLGDTGRIFKDCIKFLRDPTEAEWSSYLSTGGGKSREQRASAQAKKKVEEAEPVVEKAGDADGPRGCMSAQLSKWTPDKPLVNQVHETIRRAASQGASVPQISALTVGYAFRRYMDSLMPLLANPSIQPAHLSHFTITLETRTARSKVYTTDTSKGPVIPRGTVTAALSGKLSPAAAQAVLGFGAIPEPLAATRSSANLTALGRIRNNPALRANLPRELGTGKRRFGWLGEESPEPPAKRVRISRRTENSTLCEDLDVDVNSGAAAMAQQHGNEEEESIEDGAPLEPEPIPKREIEPGIRAYIGEASSAPKRRGRPPKNAPKRLFITAVGQKVQTWQMAQDAGVADQSSTSVEKTPIPSSPPAAVGPQTSVSEPLARSEPDEGSLQSQPNPEPQPEPEIEDEEMALGSVEPAIILEAQYNGRPGQLRLCCQEREVLFEYSPPLNGKKPLKIVLDDILDGPTIGVPPDDDGKCLVINVWRTESRWPYLFHFDDSPEMCNAAAALQRKVEALRTLDKRDSEPKASEIYISALGDAELEPEPPEPEPEPESEPGPATPQQRGKKRKRGGAASVTKGRFRCEQCGATYKNKVGLTYHRRKSQTSCNPDFVAPSISEESPRRHRITSGDDESELQQGAVIGGPREFQERSLKVITSPSKTSRRISRRLTKQSVDATLDPQATEATKDGVVQPAEEEVVNGADEEIANEADVSMAEAPAADGSGLAVNGDVVIETTKAIDVALAADKADKEAPAQNGQTPPEQAIGPDGLPVFVLPICNNPKVLPSSHRTMAVIRYLVEANGGVFPGDKGLWFAVFNLHLKQFPDESPPSMRSCQALCKTLERRKYLRMQTYAWRHLTGSSSSLSLVIKSDVPDTTPLIPELKEKIQAVHPEPYVPPSFVPPPEIRAMLEVKIQEEVARMNGRAKRKLPGEVEVLKAPFYEVARTVRLVRQELSDHELEETGPADRRSMLPLGTTDGPGDRSAWLASRLVRVSSVGRRGRRLLPDSRPRKFRRLDHPINPGLDSLPRSFYTHEHTTKAVSMPSFRFSLPLSLSNYPHYDDEMSSESASNDGSVLGDGSPSAQVQKEPAEADVASTGATSPLDLEKGAIRYSFADIVALEGPANLDESWPALGDEYFRGFDGSFTIHNSYEPHSKLILSQHMPGDLGEVPHKDNYRPEEWRDPHWAEFSWHVDSCRDWELTEDVLHLFQSSTLAPDYRFLSFNVNPAVMKVDESLQKPDTNALRWVDGCQYTVHSLPYYAVSEEVERYERSATGIKHQHLLFSQRRGRGGRGVGMGRGGSRSGARGRFSFVGHSDRSGIEAGQGIRSSGGVRRPRGARLHRVPQFKKVRELSAFPHVQEDYFENTTEESDDIDWSTHDTRIAAFVVVRTLLGGVDKTIDWGVMMRLFPDTRLSALRKFWTEARKVRGYYIDVTTEKFQDAYLAAYEREELPALNYDDVLSYDWRGLVRWTVTTVIRQVVRLPATRSRLEQDYLVDETAYKPLEWRDTYFHFQRSVWKRFQDATSEPAAILAVTRSDKRRLSSSVEETIATTWIRALCSTPRELYSPTSIRDKVQTLGIERDEDLGRLLENVILQLQVRRVICKSKASAFRSGRPYRYTKHFTETLKKTSQATKFVQAAAFKRRLDALFRSGGGRFEVRVPYAPDDGAIMAIFNLQAAGRVRVEPVGAPDIPMGFEPGNYETRKYSKDLYTFGLRVVPTRRYVCDADVGILAVARRTPPPGPGPRGELPTWCDFLGRPDAGRWAAVAGAVFFSLATRGSMDAERASEALKPLTEAFDVQAVMDWGLGVGILGELAPGGGGVCVEEWWWLAVARLFEAAGRGAEADAAGGRAQASVTEL